MRTLIRMLLFLILAPLALFVLLLIAVAAIVALPMAWEALVARLTAPPAPDDGSGRTA